MIDGALRAFSIGASVIVALSFVLFAVEHASDASKSHQSVAVDPGPSQEQTRASGHTTARELIDDANDVLLSPFVGIADRSSEWARRGVPALLGLLFYGFGVGFIARSLRVRPRRTLPTYRMTYR